LIKRFRDEIFDRIDDPSSYNPKDYFQSSWSGEQFNNQKWVDQFGKQNKEQQSQ